MVVQKQIVNDIQGMAMETSRSIYKCPQKSIELLRTRLQKILDCIDTVLERPNGYGKCLEVGLHWELCMLEEHVLHDIDTVNI